LPLAADFSGDGRADPAVYDPARSRWVVAWQVLMAPLGGKATQSAAAVGGGGWMPVAGDYDGDGKADLCLYNATTGAWRVQLSASEYATVSTSLGGASQQAIAGDFDGDGKADPAVFSESSGGWTVLLSASGYAMSFIP
jgi:hypothetical protein